jgi:GNAT superfamily N-acetyltransferase
MDIRLLTEPDVPAALALSTQAGWNQLAADWRRLLSLSPERCYAGWVDDQLVATTTVTTYETGGSWVGMVLVDVDHRRQGYGTTILEHAIEETPVAPGREIGLDATDQGIPLYREYGFEAVRDITRLSGTIDGTGGADAVDTFDAEELAPIAAYDEAAVGTARSALLSRLLSEPRTVGFVSRDGEPVDGYAIVRPGREFWQLGPVVADDADVLGHLLDAVGDHLDGERIILDSLADGAQAERLAASGLSPQRELTRMTYPDAVSLLTGEAVVAAAGLELG